MHSQIIPDDISALIISYYNWDFFNADHQVYYLKLSKWHPLVCLKNEKITANQNELKLPISLHVKIFLTEQGTSAQGLLCAWP